MKRNLEYWLKASDYFYNNQERLQNMISDGFEVIYQNKFMLTLKIKGAREYLVWNTRREWKSKDGETYGHTHIKFNPSKKRHNARGICRNMCDALAHGVAPCIEKDWIIERYLRISDDEDFNEKLLINQQILRNKSKKEKYHNVNKSGNTKR